MRRSLSQDPHRLSGAYALNALSPDERTRFEDHLAGCAACVQEVRGFSETAALLGSTAAEAPPEGLRERVMEQVSRTRQLAPAPERLPEPRRRPWGWGPWLVLAACLAVVVALGAVVADQVGQVRELRERERLISSVLTAPDAEYTSGELEEGVSMTLVHSEERGRIVFGAQGLSELEGRDYQLWVTHENGAVTPAGLLALDDEGVAVPVVAAADAEGAEGVAVTIEPEGGSEQPTTDPIAAMTFSG
ncbi:anti-sigma factor [Nocardiopsis sp. EMB25]|uniref:anti-sigma factor n=3 Tax=Nocardiopsis TaxID=2013 RepID=UPI002284F506|nr:anti-sigma factor [Nocardiopsis sp. EMB25]MCY9786420.1 anti-sigma factor [Nocardiopsis sp. EMB25]